MTASALTPLAQTLQIDQVDSVVVTPMVDDGTNTGTWVRAIRIFGEPNGVNGAPVFELRLKSTSQPNLEIATPTLNF